MNKSFKSVLNNSTGTYVAAGENAKSKGKSSKSKLAMAVASASLAVGSMISMLAPVDAFADESAEAGEYQTVATDSTDGDAVSTSNIDNLPADGDSSSGTVAPAPRKLFGSQLLGATPTGASVLYDDSTNNTITFVGTAGTKLTNVAAGTISAASMDAVNGSQLFHLTDGSAVVNSAYVKVNGANNGSDNASVSSDGGIAIGAGANSNTPGYAGSIAIGMNATAVGNGYYGATALGAGASASGSDTAIGFSTTASNTNAVALGRYAFANAASSSALGANSTATGAFSVALGATSIADVGNTVSVGSSTLKRKIVNMAAGDISSATSTDAVNGSQLYATNQNVTTNTTNIATNTADIGTLGTQVSAVATQADALSTQVSGLDTQFADAVKYDTSAQDKITFGGTAGTKLTNVAAGTISAASKDAVNGSQLFHLTDGSTVVNSAYVKVDGANNGSDNASLTSLGGIAIGAGANANTGSYTGSIAIGQNASALNNGFYGATAVGAGATAGGSGTAIGYITTATSTNSVAIGRYAFANAGSSSALGAGATATAGSSVALGANSLADVGNTISVGSSTSQRKIVNVAAGGISSATSTDAVNGSQLFATNQNVAQNTTDTAANTANITTNTTNIASNTADIGTLNTQVSAVATQADALSTQVNELDSQIADSVKYDTSAQDQITLGGTAGTKITNVSAGDISSATSTDAVNGSQLFATNQNVAQNTTNIAANTANIATNTANIASNTADIGTLNTQVSAVVTQANALSTQVNGLDTQIADSVKYDTSAQDQITLGGAAGTKITNVSAGDVTSSTSTDAVNGSQLFATNQNVAQNTTDIATNKADIATNKADIATNKADIATNKADIATNKADIATNATNIAQNTASIGTLNAAMTDTVKYDSSAHSTITLGGASGTTLTNLKAGQLTATSTDAVNGSQIYAMQQSIAAQGGQVADAVQYDSSAHDKVTLGSANTPVALTNVKAGDVSASSLDAVNGTQLYAVSQNVAQNTADIASLNSSMTDLNNGVSGIVRQDPVTQAISIGANLNGGTISFAGMGGARTLTGVANGAVNSSSTEALNGAQLFNSSSSVASALGGGASVDAKGGVVAPTYTVGGKQVNDVGSAVSNLDGRVSQNSADIAGIKGELATVSSVASNAVAYDSADHSKVTLGGADAGTAAVQLTNVAAGDLSATSTDAVNGAQLNATNDRVTAAEKAIATLDSSGVAGSTASGQDAAAIGTNADASGDHSMAAGTNATASGNSSTATGANSTASGDSSTASGANATASGSNSTASGASSMASGNNATANGAYSSASGENAAAFGGHASASGSNSVAVGANSVAAGANSVALGANSVADEANTVSVGSAGNERRITNVAPGVNGTDAVNLNQMTQLRNDVGASLTSLQRSAFGGVAGAMAMPNLMPSTPGNVVVGAGVANYKGYGAFGAGATYRSGNGKWLVNGAVSVTPAGDTGVRAQMGYEF